MPKLPIVGDKPAETGEKGFEGLKHVLTKKYGPLPGWVYIVAIGVAGYVLFFRGGSATGGGTGAYDTSAGASGSGAGGLPPLPPLPEPPATTGNIDNPPGGFGGDISAPAPASGEAFVPASSIDPRNLIGGAPGPNAYGGPVDPFGNPLDQPTVTPVVLDTAAPSAQPSATYYPSATYTEPTPEPQPVVPTDTLTVGQRWYLEHPSGPSIVASGSAQDVSGITGLPTSSPTPNIMDYGGEPLGGYTAPSAPNIMDYGGEPLGGYTTPQPALLPEPTISGGGGQRL